MQKLCVQVKFIEKSQPNTVGSVIDESSVHCCSQKFNKGRATVHDEENTAGIITNYFIHSGNDFIKKSTFDEITLIFYLFPKLKEFLDGNGFLNDEELKETFTDYLNGLAAE